MPAKFANVDKYLFRGGAPHLDELPLLKDIWNIDTIVSLDDKTSDHIDAECKRLGINHVTLPLTTGRDTNVKKIPDLIKKVMDGDFGTAYVHCLHGKDRTGMFCAMYRILADDWQLDEALKEAEKFGMGKYLSDDVCRSYYDAVKEMHQDRSFSDDAVTAVRDTMQTTQPTPAASNYSDVTFPQQSFAPFLDGQTGEGPLGNRATRLNALLKLAQSSKLYKYCQPSEVLSQNKLWSHSPDEARAAAEGNLEHARMFDADLDSTSKVITYPQETTKTLIQAAMLKDADAIFFDAPITKEWFIINPNKLINIHSEEDTNNVESGLIDNYTGVGGANSFPGSGGVLPDGGGDFAGTVQQPLSNF